MGRDDSPSFRKAYPGLALSTALRAAFEFQRDAGKVFIKADDVETSHGAGEVGSRASLSKIFNFLISIKIFGRSETHDVWITPKHPYQFFHIVGHKRALVLRVELHAVRR